MTDLGEFEGRKVTKATIAIRNAGDGLSQALEVDPTIIESGQIVYVVLECKADAVTFTPIKDSETECERKHILRAHAGTFVDYAAVKEAVTAQTEKIVKHREEQKGIQQIPTPEALIEEHDNGDHEDDPFIGCPECYPDAFAVGQ